VAVTLHAEDIYPVNGQLILDIYPCVRRGPGIVWLHAEEPCLPGSAVLRRPFVSVSSRQRAKVAHYSLELRICRSETGNIHQGSLSAADHDLQWERDQAGAGLKAGTLPLLAAVWIHSAYVFANII
jgi:hypothetical protein